MKRIAIGLAILIALSIAILGCGGNQGGAERLQACGKAVANYIASGGYIKFSQQMQYGLTTDDGTLDQEIDMRGAAMFPDRENYDYQETIKSSKTSNEEQSNSFTYLTLDAGKTAFVKGDALSSQLGVVGWVHYTPPAGQNRYFNFSQLMSRLTTPQGTVETLGREDISGNQCIHLAYDLSGEDLIDLQLQENPSLKEQYEGVDLTQVIGDLRLEIWIGESDNLPRRALMDQSMTGGGITSSTNLRIELSGYGETPLIPIEQPGFFSEAQ
ncbi:MAG: hypothetical protein A2W01_07825 [Candidatus Solincola sediminis]|nr:MAG: hypothetical protein A2W01_07825 [Candidatus Solincola sediminis]